MRWLPMLVFLASSNPVLATDSQGAPPAARAGAVHFDASCSSAAQDEFVRGLTLLHHMTYPEAQASFRRAVDIDPACAMARWGIAMTLFQPLWPTRPSPADLQQGWDETQRAKSATHLTARERGFIAAAEAFFLLPHEGDYWLRIRRWEAAQQKLHEAFPDDPEATVFYALALLATAPSDVVSREHADRAAALLLSVAATHPDHPGVMHYLVHANDMPGREHENLDVTRKYAAAAPRNPHALHMPTHIFTRLGDWDAVVRGNLLAAEAALEHPAGDRQQFVWDEFPHAIEYLVYAYLQQGRDDEARAEVERLRSTPHLEPTFKTAFHLASTRARLALERQAWAEAASIDPRTPEFVDWDRFGWPEAIGWFARGLGCARTGRLVDARDALEHLAGLERSTSGSGEELFARHVSLLRLELAAWLAAAQHDRTQSLASMREAAALEASTPKPAVTPAPTLPAGEQLGDLLLEMNRPAEALEAYRSSLQLYPRRFNSLLGAARAARAAGNAGASAGYYRELLQTAGDSRRPSLDEARRSGRAGE